MSTQTPSAAEVYDHFWMQARPLLAAGRVEVDPLLTDRASDHRRGMTLAIRPGPATQAALAPFLDALAAAAPEQYHYRLSQLHVTVLSLFTATPAWEPHFARTAEYVAAVDAAVAQVAPFRIRFCGVTATSGAVMVQGFADAALNQLRDALRTHMAQAGLGAGLDRRYRVSLAHMTAMRFQQPLGNAAALLAALERFRSAPLDVTAVTTFELLDNDWYMSPDRVRLIKQYSLLGG